MNITKHALPAYSLSRDGEWATIVVAPQVQDGRQGGLLMVESSFGNFAYSWSSCGMDFRKFLSKISLNYFAQKVRGHDAEVFDDEASSQAILHRLDQVRNAILAGEHPGLTLADIEIDLKEITAFCEEIHAFSAYPPQMIMAFEQLSLEHPDLFEGLPEYCIKTKLDPQVEQFWTTFWPALIHVLNEELAEACPDGKPVSRKPGVW